MILTTAYFFPFNEKVLNINPDFLRSSFLGIFSLSELPSLTEFRVIKWIAWMSFFLVGIKFCERFFMVLGLVLSTYLFFVVNSIAEWNHNGGFLVLMQLGFVFSSFQKEKYSRLPLFLPRLLIFLMLFFAGIEKLRISGFEWALSENVAIVLNDMAAGKLSLWFSSILNQRLWLSSIIGSFVIFFELAAFVIFIQKYCIDVIYTAMVFVFILLMAMFVQETFYEILPSLFLILFDNRWLKLDLE